MKMFFFLNILHNNIMIVIGSLIFCPCVRCELSYINEVCYSFSCPGPSGWMLFWVGWSLYLILFGSSGKWAILRFYMSLTARSLRHVSHLGLAYLHIIWEWVSLVSPIRTLVNKIFCIVLIYIMVLLT